ncbi:MAG: S-layer homology domain-containing protein, partial [Nitriliruptoraceae bacterium]
MSGVLALALQHHPELTAEEAVEAVRDTVRPLETTAATVAGGIVRAPALLDHLGTRVAACPEVDPDALPFGDVSGTSPHRDAVACLLDRGVAQGVSAEAFGSERGLSRAQIASLVARTLREAGVTPTVPSDGRFDDVAAESVHHDAIEALAAVGIVEGRTATTYDPSATTSRAELAAVVARAAEFLAEGEVRARGPGFADTAGVADEPWIDKAAGLRIVLGRTPE